MPLLLDEQQRDELIALLARGASSAVACRELGVDHDCFLLTMRQDGEFRSRVEGVQEMLTRNVSAALYKSALEGKVTAQTFYLRHYSQPEPEEEQEDLSGLSIDDLRHMLLAKLPEAETPNTEETETSE